MVDRYESALKTLANIVETGGYIKKKTREEVQQAVSIIRNCFRELTKTAGELIRKEGQTEVMGGETEHLCDEGESRNMGQVAPSIEETQNVEVRDQPVIDQPKCQEDVATPTCNLRRLTVNRRRCKQIWKNK